MALVKNITGEKKGKRGQYHLPYDIKDVWKNIKWGRISSCRELYAPLFELFII